MSLVLGRLAPLYRQEGGLGTWQVISPQQVAGRLEHVAELHTVQDDVYSQPTILLVDRVSGEEEVPEGVVGLLTSDAPDVLSHVSVRARNMGVLFAASYQSEVLG